MRWLNLASIRLRLLVLLIVALLPAAVLLLYTATEQRRLAATTAQQSAWQLIRPATVEYERLLEGARQLLMVLAHVPAVRARDAPAASAFFAELIRKYPLYQNLAAAAPNGDVIASGLPLPGRVNVADRSYFQRAIQTRDFVIGEFQIGRITRKAQVVCGYPVLDEAERVQGVVYASLDLAWLSQRAAQAQLPKGSVLTLMDQRGTILVRSPDGARWIGKTLAEMPLAKTILTQRIGVTEARGADGIQRLYVFTPLGGTAHAATAYLALGIPTAVVFTEANSMLARNLAFLGLVGVLTLLVAWVGSDRFVLCRIQNLVQAANRLSAGDLSARTGLAAGRDELGQLAKAFDEMAGSLERLTRQNQLILASAGEGIYGVDPNGSITFVNPAAAAMLGWEVTELVGKFSHAVLHHSRPDGSPYPWEECIIHAAFQEGVTHRATDEVFWRKDRTSFPVEYVATPMREDGEITGAVVVFSDITARKRLEEEHVRLLAREKEARAAAEEASAAKDRFLATVSHELRNPLAPILTGIEILRRSVPPEAKTERILQIMERNTKILSRLISDTLDISLITSGKVELQRQPLMLDAVVQDAIASRRIDAQRAGLTLTSELQPDLWVCGDRARLQQAVAHLIANAIRFTPSGGEIRVRVATRALAVNPQRTVSPSPTATPHTPLAAPHGSACVVVEDTGAGIDPDMMLRLFDIFQRGVIGGWGKPGLGIGLALTKWIASEHGGRIWAESEGRGQGSRFTIELPLIPAPAPPTDG